LFGIQAVRLEQLRRQAMPFWQLHYHFVWATKDRVPIIEPQAEPIIYNLIRGKAAGLGASVFALNGTADHVHLVAAVPPKLALAEFIGQVKGVTSARYNQAGPRETPLYWQDEYGVFSFDGKRLPNYIAYVENQKQHHAQSLLLPILERTNDLALPFLQESQAPYRQDDAAWWSEMELMDDTNTKPL
jgi:REP-associated tyrosine transposase